jgi:hypothetical protein
MAPGPAGAVQRRDALTHQGASIRLLGLSCAAPAIKECRMNLAAHPLTMTVLVMPDMANFAGNFAPAHEAGFAPLAQVLRLQGSGRAARSA